MSSSIEAGKAYVSVSLRNNLDAGIRELQSKLTVLSKSLTAYGKSVSKIGFAIGAAFGSALAVLSRPVVVASGIETQTASFEALTGSATAAANIIARLREFASVTPLQFPGLAKTTTLLLGYGIASNRVVSDVKVLSEVAQGNEVRLERLGLAFGQVAAKGRLMATEVRQFTESGFNPLQEIARKTGKSMGSLLDEMERGQITFDQVRASFQSATSAGGRFFGLLYKQSQTLAGLFTTLKDNIDIAIEPFGKALLPLLKSTLQSSIELTKSFAMFAQANADLIIPIAAVVAGATALGIAITAIGGSLIIAGGFIAAFNTLVLEGGLNLRRLTGIKPPNALVETLRGVKDEAAALSTGIVISSTEVRLQLTQTTRSFVRLEKQASKSLTALTLKTSVASTAMGASFAAISASAMAASTAICAAATRAGACITAMAALGGTMTASLSGASSSITTFGTATKGVASTSKKVAKSPPVSGDTIDNVMDVFTPSTKRPVDLNDLVDIGAKNLQSEVAENLSFTTDIVGSWAKETNDASQKINFQVPKSLDELVSGIEGGLKETAKSGDGIKSLLAKGFIDDIDKGRVAQSAQEQMLEALGLNEDTAKSAVVNVFDAIEEAFPSDIGKKEVGFVDLGAEFADEMAGFSKSLTTPLLTPLKFISSSFKSVFGGLIAFVAPIGAAFTAVGSAMLAPFTAVLGPVLGTVVAIGALAAGFVYLLNRAGLLKPMIEGVISTFNTFVGIISKTFGGISKAIGAGEYLLAVKILWAGIKLAFFTGAEKAVQLLPVIFENAGTVLYKLGEAIVNTVVDIVSAIPSLIMAAISGTQSISQILYDIFVGNFNSGELNKLTDGARNELDSLNAQANTAFDGVKKSQKAEADAAKQKQDNADALALKKEEGFNANLAAIAKEDRDRELLAKGVASVALGMTDEAIGEANKAANERVLSLQDEVAELLHGKDAVDQYKLAVGGVTGENRLAIANLTKLKAALEMGKEIKSRIDSLQSETHAVIYGADAAERLKLAQEGATDAQLASLAAAQGYTRYLQTNRSISDEITSLSLGANAAELLKLKRDGLSEAELVSVALLQQRRDALAEEKRAMEDLKNEAKSLKDSFKTPLQKFREQQKKIAEMQAAGLIDQGIAAQAFAEAIAKLREESMSLRQPLGTVEVGSSEALAAQQRARERARALIDQAAGIQLARANANAQIDKANEAVNRAQPTPKSELEQRIEKIQQDQLTALGRIAAAAEKPTQVVSIY